MKKILVLILILICTPSFAEKIELMSGQTVRGKFVGRGQDFVRVDTGLGVELNYYLDEIESVDGEPFNEDILEDVPEVLEEEFERPAEIPEEILGDIPAKPVPVQQKDLDIKFMYIQEQVNKELEKGNVNRAFKIAENLFEQCDDFEEDRCLAAFDLYLSVVEYALIFIDEGGLYSKIDNYAKGFIENIESIDNLSDMLARVDALGDGQKNSFSKVFQIYAFYGLYLASKKDIQGAQEFILTARRLDANFGKQLQGLIEPYQRIFSDRDFLALYNVIYDMKLRLSVLIEATAILKGLYDKFQVDPSVGEDRIIAQLEAHLDTVKKEIFSFKSKKEFDSKTLPSFVYLLDTETPNFLVWYFKNFRKHSSELKKEMNGRFKSAFVSMINYMLLKARGFDVYYVFTCANAIGKNEIDSSGSSFFNPFAEKKKRVERVERSLCAIKIGDKNFVLVDFLDHWISKKFVLEDIYDKKGAIYYEMKPGIKRDDLYGNFQLSKDALVAPNVIINLLLQMNRMGYQVEIDNRSLKLAKIKNPHSRNAYHLLAYIASENSTTTEAVKYLNMSLKVYPDDPETYYLMGQIYYEAKDYPNGIESLKKALKIDPGFTEAKLILAYSYQGFSDYGAALELAKECLKDSPKDSSVHIMLLQLYVSFGNIPAAERHARAAAKILKSEGSNERADSVMQYIKNLKKTNRDNKKRRKYLK